MLITVNLWSSSWLPTRSTSVAVVPVERTVPEGRFKLNLLEERLLIINFIIRPVKTIAWLSTDIHSTLHTRSATRSVHVHVPNRDRSIVRQKVPRWRLWWYLSLSVYLRANRYLCAPRQYREREREVTASRHNKYINYIIQVHSRDSSSSSTKNEPCHVCPCSVGE